MDIEKLFFDEIDKGEKGLNKGLPMGFKRLNSVVCNLQRGRFDLVGGSTGTGKSSFIMNGYVTNPIQYLVDTNNTNTKFRVVYFNMELPTKDVIAKLIAARVYKKTNAEVELHVNKIFAKGIFADKEHRMTPEEKKLVKDEASYIEHLRKYVRFEEGGITPDYAYKVIMAELSKLGKIEQYKDKGDHWEFTPYQDDYYLVVIFDHIGLIKPNLAKDSSLKHTIDRLSGMLVDLRNKASITPVLVSQFNRSIEGMDRKSNKHPDPQLSDFKESGRPSEDANTVFALFNPYKHRIDTHHGYNLKALPKVYRGLSILKNRDGRDNVDIGLGFKGTIGEFKELPHSSRLNPEHQDSQSLMKQLTEYYS